MMATAMTDARINGQIGQPAASIMASTGYDSTKKQQAKCSAHVPVSASTNYSDKVWVCFAEFSTIDVDKSVRNYLAHSLSTRPQREIWFGPKNDQYTYS
jgi:hypothetical protein